MAYDRGGDSSGNEEKAYATASHSRDRIINTSSRPTNGSSSRFARTAANSHDADRRRSRSPYRAERRRSRSPYRIRRDRSRSPYRVQKEQNSSKGKRQHDGDHYSKSSSSDPRRFKAHYEDDEKHTKRDRDDLADRMNTSGKYRLDKQIRDRSRSPYHHNRTASKDDRPTTSGSAAPEETNTAIGVPLEYVEHTSMKHASADSGRTEHEETVQLTEAELIEQRRKRREAIKAKHKTQQPLLMQALEQHKTSAPGTPVHDGLSTNGMQSGMLVVPSSCTVADHTSASNLDSPMTPSEVSAGSPAPFSPGSFTADNMEDLIHHNDDAAIVADEGPSAADYDPTMDMQEDRRDIQQTSQPAENLPIPKDDLDMFADAGDDDDDDDMFASESKKKTKTVNTTTEAKTLDQSLLDNWDYPDGHYRIIIGELLDGRYAVQQQVGKGTFATVVRALEVKTGKSVAIKIACNNETMYKAGTKEMDFLKVLNDTDPEDKRHIIRLLGNFDHKGHMCLVFENLSADLRETLKRYGRNVGLNLIALRAFAHQMFQALLHMQRNEILHSDLKPDNILISEKNNVIKVCDLGTAAKIDDTEVTPYLVSRFYRAPEVMLGMPFDYAIDMWSIGCTLFELYTGRILFAGSDNNQMLRVIQECRGKVPNRMLKKSTLFDRHYDQFGNFISTERDKITGQTTMRPLMLTKVAPGKDLRARTMINTKDTDPLKLKEVQAFVDLLDKCLQLDPAKRITPTDALKHYFITHVTPGEKAEKKKITALAPARIR